MEHFKKFKFQKIDGTLREAVGTTNLKFIPAEKHPKNVNAPLPNNTIPYFDLVENKWKSMNINSQFIHLFRIHFNPESRSSCGYQPDFNNGESSST